MSPSIADIDLELLSDRGREALELIARPLSDGVPIEEIADSLGVDPREAQNRLDHLAAEWTNLAGGADVPRLSALEYEALKASLAEHGLLVPILVDARNKIIDGHNRMRACRELGIEPRIEVLEWIKTDNDAKRLGMVVNIARRQLPTSARRAVGLAELMADPAQSDRSIAVRVGLSPTTVGELRRELEKSAGLTKMPRRKGRDGRTITPAPRRATVQSGQSDQFEHEHDQPIGKGQELPQEPVVEYFATVLTCPHCGQAFDPREG